ncbi:sensor domain-containing diguanylate cyclase [Castellaniella sp.]|uniref:sensor domain-containing diguanylate cyclase n=1 Tax=Castellaniella sp. TaxID=1955812 RepID=UPI002AFE00D7|nr:sensor domain-containing diguanylate cyclase [Castellaniella sp.]
MLIRPRARITLRQLVLILSIGSVLIMLIAGAIGVYHVQREQLMDDTLTSNQAFAEKLAASTSNLLEQAQQDLAYTAERIVQSRQQPSQWQSEVDRLRAQGVGFNTVSLTDSQGVISTVSPRSRNLQGKHTDQNSPNAGLRHQTPTISSPLTTMLGNLAIQLTHPLYTQSNQYLGYLTGTIYLKSDGALARQLGEHFFRNDTYVYVVDSARRLLYHPKTDRIGTTVTINPVVDAVLTGQHGMQRITNSQGVDMLAGFAYVPETKWGIVVQRPTLVTLSQLSKLMRNMLWQLMIPVALLLALLWYLSNLVSRPLGELAQIVQNGYEDQMVQRIRSVRCWYFEADHLQGALLSGLGAVGLQLGQLQEAAYQDPMTGLGNRRGLSLALQACLSMNQPFSVIALDIDFFKSINDTHGHDVGDQIICQIGDRMRSQAREGDALFRMGGEEFLAILPNTQTDIATAIAERLRSNIEQATILPDRNVTVSIGVAGWRPGQDTTGEHIIKAADQALYQAKQSGRNQVICHQTDMD